MSDVQVSGSTGAISADSKGRLRRRIGFIAGLAVVAGFALPAAGAQAALPQVINTATGCAGQTSWLVTCATAGETGNSANVIRYSVLVSHDSDKTLASLIADEDWDPATNNPTVLRNVSATRPATPSGYPRSRASISYNQPTAGSGITKSTTFGVCTGGTRRIDNRVARIAPRDSAGQTGGTTSSTIKFVATDGCTGPEEFAYVYGLAAGNFGKESVPSASQTYTYNGDDPDSTGNADFQGINWRYRNLRTGATTTPQISCPGNGDNQVKTLTTNAPATRGAYVLEAELRTGGGCGQDQNPGYWFAIGTVDVNSASIPNRGIDVPARVNTGATTIDATVDPPADPDGGGPQIVQYDLDFNTGNGVSGFEADTIAAEGATITANQTRTVNVAGLTPGQTYTVRARVIDNGAMDAADAIRRTSGTATDTFTVNRVPTATGQTVDATTEAPKSITLNGNDADGDALTYSIVSGPANGSLTGSGANRTYTSDAGFAGTDSFTYNVSDNFNGTSSTVTVTINVQPETTIDAGPAGGSTVQPDEVAFEFSSNATGATFECRIDAAAFAPCNSGDAIPGLADGTYTFQVRATAGGQTDQTPASRTFTVDGTAPETTITSGPSGSTQDQTVTFEFSSSEPNSTFECSVDGAAFTSCTSPATYSSLGNGPHTFAVQATDAAGNTDPTPDTRSFTITDNAVASSGGGTTTFSASPGDSNNVSVTGGGGSDYVITDNGGNDIDAGAPCTQVTSNSVSCPDTANITINLGDSNDTFDGSGIAGGALVINGGAGNDNLTGSPGDDTINGGPDAGNDRMTGGPGADAINGGDGIDRAVYSGSGSGVNITIDGVANDDDGTGSTTENVATDVESITGSNGDDTITGSCTNNTIAGIAGNDTLNGDPGATGDCGVGGNDFMGGGADDDAINGIDGTDVVVYSTNTAGQAINVSLDGAANDADGLGGTDNIADDIETVFGGAGDDTIDASGANQGVALWGRTGNDTLTGSDFNDYVRGQEGADIVDCGGDDNDQFEDDPADTITNCETPGT